MDKLASTDYLTGVPNRREFNKFISEKIHHYNKDREAFFFGILDIDHFKKLNDYYGHAAGDVILRTISLEITSTIPSGYFFARIGGEEFALATSSNLSQNSAYTFYNSIRELIKNITIKYFDETITCTASIGFTAIHEGDVQIEDIYARADKALYNAKNSGRNIVKFST